MVSDAVVVTGATGFLARHTLPVLERPMVCCVRSVERWRSQPWAAKLSARTIQADLGDLERIGSDLSPVRCVIHMAALVRHSRRDSAIVYETNVEGTLHAVRLAARLGARLVLISTSGTVGCFRAPGIRADESAPYCEDTVRQWPYYHSKLEAERRARGLAQALGVELVIVRLPILLGPGDQGGRSTSHVRRFVSGKLPFLIRGGIQVVDVRDVAKALNAMVEIPSPNPVYHLAGFAGSTREFFRACAQITRQRLPPQVPYAWAWGAAYAAERMARGIGRHSPLPEPVVVEMASHWWNIGSEGARGLGFRARPLEDTLGDVIAWLGEVPGAH